jgi:hypothetical protein
MQSSVFARNNTFPEVCYFGWLGCGPLWLEREKAEETEAIERQKKEQKEREEMFAEQRRKREEESRPPEQRPPH